MGSGSVVIISGAPGSGKTTLARELARTDGHGVHLVSDFFYEFVATPIDPSTPESHRQNTVILRAVTQAARAFASGGYVVYLDGVIGPWFLHVLREVLAPAIPTQYVLLEVSEQEAMRRVRQREGSARIPMVRSMVPQFIDLGGWASHAVDTRDRSATEIRDAVRKGLAKDRFTLDWTLTHA